MSTKDENSTEVQYDAKLPVSGSNCSKCVFFKYEASWGMVGVTMVIRSIQAN